MTDNKPECGGCSQIADRLDALLPELEYSRETHVQWRDCPQHCRDRNPEIGDSDFHARAVVDYDERIAAIKAASRELRERTIEVVPACADPEETDQSIAADSYWHIADVIGTEQSWSVQEHVEWMKELLQQASDYLHDIPESAVGGCDTAVELCRRLRVCLAGKAPGFLGDLPEDAQPARQAGGEVRELVNRFLSWPFPR